MLLSRRILMGAIGTLPLTRLARAAPAHRLTILHLNDLHSRHLPVDARALTCTPDRSSCYGGTPRLATAIREQRQAAEADGRTVILLDAGDQFQGSLFYTAHRGATELAVQHAIGVDAMTLGNHEFDNGPETLGRYLEAARFPILAANLETTAEPDLRGNVKPWTMLDRGPLRIAVIGLTTAEAATTSSPGPNIRFLPPRPALDKAALEARNAGATIILLLSHLGLPLDRTLDHPHLAAIIGGHSHTLLSNDEPGAQGPYPSTGLPSPGLSFTGLNTPLIVQAGAFGRYLGRLDLDLADDGKILAYAGTCRHIDPALPEDPETAAIVARFAEPLEELRNRPVATLPEPLDIAACRVAQCPLGHRVADAMRHAAHDADIAIMNAGGLRTGLPAGPLTLGQILDSMPFGNTLATATIAGKDLESAVTHGLSMAGRGAFPQFAGLRLVPFPPSIEIQNPDQTWSPLDPARPYRLATNNFLLNGGDGYTVLKSTQDQYDSGPNLADLFADYLATP